MATREQIRKIYAIGSALGIKGTDRGDLLHELVYSVTGKDSIKELSEDEARAVLKELYSRQPAGSKPAPKRRKKQEPREQLGNDGMATREQQALCWRYCYRLRELDPRPNSAEAADRLLGAIDKVLGVTASKKEPFRWVDQEQASKLIEQLKRYVNTAERQARRRGDRRADGS